MTTATDEQRREAEATTRVLLAAAEPLAGSDAALVRKLTAERARLIAKGRRHSAPRPRPMRWALFAAHIPSVPLGQ